MSFPFGGYLTVISFLEDFFKSLLIRIKQEPYIIPYPPHFFFLTDLCNPEVWKILVIVDLNMICLGGSVNCDKVCLENNLSCSRSHTNIYMV